MISCLVYGVCLFLVLLLLIGLVVESPGLCVIVFVLGSPLIYWMNLAYTDRDMDFRTEELRLDITNEIPYVIDGDRLIQMDFPRNVTTEDIILKKWWPNERPYCGLWLLPRSTEYKLKGEPDAK